MRDYATISKRLRRYSENCVAYKLDADFANAVTDAADAIEELLAENKAIKQSNKDAAMRNKLLCDEISRMKEKVPHWISVEERLPDNTKQQIVKHRGGVYFAYYNGSTWYSSIGKSHPLLTVTHWMPLPKEPEPPKGVE